MGDPAELALQRARVGWRTSRALAKKLAPYGVTANGIAPGVIYTPLHERTNTPESLERLRQTIPLLRLGAPMDVAGMAAFPGIARRLLHHGRDHRRQRRHAHGLRRASTMKLAGKVAVVTGGGSGIGAAICAAFAGEGAAVAVTDINLDAARQVALQIQAGGGRAVAYGFDVSQAAPVAAAADEIERVLGPLDIWVNNAGISPVVPFLECSEELWDRVLRINLKGTYIGCQVAIRHLLPRSRGVLLNMSSQSGRQGSSHYAAYSASKFGILGLTQSLAVEFAAQASGSTPCARA